MTLVIKGSSCSLLSIAEVMAKIILFSFFNSGCFESIFRELKPSGLIVLSIISPAKFNVELGPRIGSTMYGPDFMP